MNIGAHYDSQQGKCKFNLWAPGTQKVNVRILDPSVIIPMKKDDKGYWRAEKNGIKPGASYTYVLDDKKERPDPASAFQSQGVHGPSVVVDHGSFAWTDQNWQGIPLPEMIIYEIHVGTFTQKGTFGAVISRLKELVQLGVNAVELMPVAQFPGGRNWGYDGVYPFAVQDSYGGPEGLKQLVNACHNHGLAVILDVVYNHMGPEGNYLNDFGPYFTKKYRTPWGRALNFDDQDCDHVRNFFIKNALYWFEHYHFDALRLDAVHAIFDMSARPFLQQLAQEVKSYAQKRKRPCYLIAESDLNDTRIIRPMEQGGFGLDAQWSDDLHHSLHTLLTRETSGYYRDFGQLDDLAKAIKETFVYDGRYSEFRQRHHGNSASDLPGEQFVISIQNHDQVGNRMKGERLSSLVSLERLKLAAGVLFSSPYIPLLFMGEEYAADTPFFYFVSHTDKDLIEAVRSGRKAEFQSFHWEGEPDDPQLESTFQKSQLNWSQKKIGRHKMMVSFYQRLISLRKTAKTLSCLDKEHLSVDCLNQNLVMIWQRWFQDERAVVVFNFHDKGQKVKVNNTSGVFRKMIDSADRQWLGPGSGLPDKTDFNQQLDINPESFAVYQLEGQT